MHVDLQSAGGAQQELKSKSDWLVQQREWGGTGGGEAGAGQAFLHLWEVEEKSRAWARPARANAYQI